MIPKFRAWWIQDEVMTHIDTLEFLQGGIRVSDGCWHEKFLGDEVILMQSTGLKDKNGVEIFEGDICKIQRIPSGMRPIFLVSDYIKEKLIFSKITILGQNSYEETGGYTGNFLEVIGNRFENPELLEVEGK